MDFSSWQNSPRAGAARAPAGTRDMRSVKGVLAPSGGRRDLADASGDLPLQTGDQSQVQAEEEEARPGPAGGRNFRGYCLRVRVCGVCQGCRLACVGGRQSTEGLWLTRSCVETLHGLDTAGRAET